MFPRTLELRGNNLNLNKIAGPVNADKIMKEVFKFNYMKQTFTILYSPKGFTWDEKEFHETIGEAVDSAINFCHHN